MFARNAPRVPFKPTPVANLFYRIAGNNDPRSRWHVAHMEKQREPRRRTLKTAHIVFNDGGSVIDCLVRNLSPGGALLVLPSVFGVPEIFELLIDSDGSLRSARTIWRGHGQMGVAFGKAPPRSEPYRNLA